MNKIFRIKKRNSLVLFLFFCFLNAKSQSQDSLIHFSHPQMGTVFHVYLNTKDSVLAKATIPKVFKKLDDLNMILSDYREDSELNQLCKNAYNQPVRVSNDLCKIIKTSIEAEKLSNGYFDITVGSLIRLWRRMKRQKQLPKPEQIEEAKSKMGVKNILLNTDNQSVRLIKQGIRIDFGGIGKGFAEDEMMKILKENQVKSAMIEAGGNILILGENWEVEINSKKHKLSNCAVSTSGDLFQFVEIEGKKYSHIVNPKTGIILSKNKQITVVSENSTTADWVSTSVFLMTKKEGRKLAKKTNSKVYFY